jgi:hypothetical protein
MDTHPSIWRTVRAFAWLRWRVLINSLERRGSRDVIERFSIAFEQLAPALVALMMVPSAAALAGLGTYAGWTLGQGHPGTAFGFTRLALLAAAALTIAGPILLPAAERTNAVRLLLLPIPRVVLYLSQFMSALADPWILLAGVLLLAIPLGIALGGNAAAAGLMLSRVWRCWSRWSGCRSSSPAPSTWSAAIAGAPNCSACCLSSSCR